MVSFDCDSRHCSKMWMLPSTEKIFLLATLGIHGSNFGGSAERTEDCEAWMLLLVQQPTAIRVAIGYHHRKYYF